MNATTASDNNQIPGRRQFAQSALALLIAPTTGFASETRIADRDLRREQVLSLCQEVEFMRAWFGRYEVEIKAMNKRAAYELNDTAVSAACTARALARAAGVTLDRYESFPWGVDSRDINTV